MANCEVILGVKRAAIESTCAQALTVLERLKIKVLHTLTLGQNACMTCECTREAIDTLIAEKQWWLMYSIVDDGKDHSNPAIEGL